MKVCDGYCTSPFRFLFDTKIGKRKNVEVYKSLFDIEIQLNIETNVNKLIVANETKNLIFNLFSECQWALVVIEKEVDDIACPP